MRRWLWFSFCAVLALALIGCGLLVPAHLRATDASVLAKAGRKTPGLIEVAWSEGRLDHPGSARLLLEAARQQQLEGVEALATALVSLDREHPEWLAWGGRPPGLPLDPKLPVAADTVRNATSSSITDIVVPEANRNRVLKGLASSEKVVVQELLHSRALTNTVLFSPSQSASGQAFDAAIALTGLLLEGGHMSPALSNVTFTLAYDANHGSSPQPLEQTLMDLLSVGQRLDWTQTAALMHRIQDAETLRLLANFLRPDPAHLPILYSAMLMASQPRTVVDYMVKFSRTGILDLGAALSYNSGGLDRLLAGQKRFHLARYGAPPFLKGVEDALVELAWSSPEIALGLKGILYLAGGFLLALAAHTLVQWRAARKEILVEERNAARAPAYRAGREYTQAPARRAGLLTPNFHLAREVLFSLGFLVVMLLVAEPFMADEVQTTQVPFRLRLPTIASVIPAAGAPIHSPFMNQLSLLTLLLFFVIQALLYVASLVKLAEIRRQRVQARVRLRLLENEDHLFDAGLYLGFVGTIISLILVSMGVIKPSLMAAYSSTSFGIIFVSAFKIFHLRPLRRQLVLESEQAAPETGYPSGARVATPTP